MQWINDRIAIGSRSDLKHIDLNEFDAILSLDSTTLNNIPKYWTGIYHSVCIPDSKNVEVEQVKEALDFLKALGDRQIFIHCKMGRSRSVSIATIYLHRLHGSRSIEEALDGAEKLIRNAKITKSFKKKLLEFSKAGLI